MKGNDDVIRDFNEYVNMTADELEKWLKSSDSQSAGWPKENGAGESVGHDSGRKIVEILKANPKKEAKKYTEDQISHMRKVASYCARHLAQEEKSNNEKSPEEVKKTKSYASLMNWGHDPLKKRGVKGNGTNKGAANGKSTGTKKEAEKDAEKDEQQNGDDNKDDDDDEEEKEDSADKRAGDKRKAADAQKGKNKAAKTEQTTEKRATRSSTRNKPAEEKEEEKPKPAEKKTAAKDDSKKKDSKKKEEEEQKKKKEEEEQKKKKEEEAQKSKEEETSKSNNKKSGGKASKGPNPGDKVSWNWGNGQPEGKVLDVKEDKATITTKRGNKVSRDGSKDDPAVVLDTGKSKAIKSNHELN